MSPLMKFDEHVLGSRDARVTLVEYGDYECDKSGRAALVLQVVLDELGDSVRFAYRHFPLRAAHPNAMAAAEAAESVAAHAGASAFWAMHAILFENQDALEIDDLLGYAAAAGADVADIALDLATGARRQRIEYDIHRALSDGVSNTPTFCVNGRLLEGEWNDADAFTEALQAAAREGALS
jgi:protein-disulfide isomerase